MRDPVEAGQLQLFCVDSVDADSLYCDHRPPWERIERHRQFVDYIVREVAPFTAQKNACNSLVAHGCSIGAYHAMNIALRHPELFTKVVAFSGRYDLTRVVLSFRDLFDGYYSEDIYFHTPNHFLRGLNDHAILGQIRRLDITITVGEQDPFRESSSELSGILCQKDIPHRLLLWDEEAHRAHYWRKMAQLYLTGCAYWS